MNGFKNLDPVHILRVSAVRMSRPQDIHKSFLPFGNPLRMILPKGSHLSPKLLALSNNFEETLAEKLKKLKPADKEEVLHLSWMECAMKSLCEIHADVKNLIAALELPVCDWDQMWVNMYLDTSMKLLDICIAFNSEISRLKNGHFFLRCALLNLSDASFAEARTSLDEWKQHVNATNPRLDDCFSVMDRLAQMLDLPKIKNSAKEKVLMQAMYGVKVVTLFVSSIFAAAFSGSKNKLMDIQVPETYLWAENFAELQTFVNTEIRNMFSNGRFMVLRERETVDTCIERLYHIVQDGGVCLVEAEVLETLKSDLEKSSGKFSQGLDLLAREVNGFFKIVMSGRGAVLDNLRVAFDVFDPLPANKNVEGQMVR